jgi:hypothetical protein
MVHDLVNATLVGRVARHFLRNKLDDFEPTAA